MNKIDSENSSQTLALSAYSRIRADIIDGTLEPGRKLRIAELCDTYELGSSPLREALNRACADGLVLKREQRGFYVSEISELDLLALTNTRLWLEETALRQTLCNDPEGWEERILVAFHRLQKNSKTIKDENFLSNTSWGELHRDFHMELVSGCGSEWLIRYCEQLYDQSRRYRIKISSTRTTRPRRNRETINRHRDLIDACIEGDVEASAKALAEHYLLSAEAVLNTKLRLLENPFRIVELEK
ncbi:MAG: GntR family transcriptional regulator [Rhodospirillaceae bacterium]|jgi:DNA-binding GntR family transcriptional regulator|nr:GntR family transcriptional regulator [Rhodospirillales bacterium]MBT3907500.1 GntR family transcriptional regulator [Rhodospirillaceae bacterium]MBT4699753.1 GntR family transcriptional regulator [Rhodospirillaceae bacterium]MBT5035565.1 GntR family transcriptional regulator [Rhodospirillaceae bacterium]MBT6219100.1 GntR family transcriptional regulator [Rhodospirillaceae bacterium]